MKVVKEKKKRKHFFSAVIYFFFFYPFLRLAQSNCPRADDTLALHYTCRGSIKTQADFTPNVVKITSWKCVWPEIWPVFADFWVQLSTVQLVPVFKYLFLYLSSIHPSSTTFTLKGSGGCSCLRGFLLSAGLTYRDKQPFTPKETWNRPISQNNVFGLWTAPRKAWGFEPGNLLAVRGCSAMSYWILSPTMEGSLLLTPEQ